VIESFGVTWVVLSDQLLPFVHCGTKSLPGEGYGVLVTLDFGAGLFLPNLRSQSTIYEPSPAGGAGAGATADKVQRR
jgi:hypothetical protein